MQGGKSDRGLVNRLGWSRGPRAPAGRWRHRPAGRRLAWPHWSPVLINVVGLLVMVFCMGGSSRGDVWSLPLLRPVAILSLFYGVWSLSRADVTRHRFLFGMAAAVSTLLIFHLIPLPPFMWSGLGGRDILVDIDAATGLTGTWRPISMAPEFTWNALFALAVPLAILTNAVRLSPDEHRTVVMVVVLGGLFSVVMGLLQLASSGDPTFYFYRRSNFGMANGLFANRNHQALFLAMMLPLLGYLLATSDRRTLGGETIRFLCYAGALVAITFLVILGSRAGLAAGAIGLATFALLPLLAGRQGGGGRGLPRAQLVIGAAMLLAVIGILAWATFAGSGEAIQRAVDSADTEELRYKLWPIIVQSMPHYLPMGTGVGTYERVFQMIEPDAILRPTYSNHAHNDWLEVAWTAGLPGVMLMVLAVLGFFEAMRRTLALRAGNARGKALMGLVLILIAAIGSIVDYPLRTPLLSALFALACVWVAVGLRSTRSEAETVFDTQERIEGRVNS